MSPPDDDVVDGDDVPVNKKTSFNGKLNQYFHHVTKVKTVLDQQKPASILSSSSPAMMQKVVKATTTQLVENGPRTSMTATGITRQRVTRSQSSLRTSSNTTTTSTTGSPYPYPSENDSSAPASSPSLNIQRSSSSTLSSSSSSSSSSSALSSPMKRKKKKQRQRIENPSFSPPSRLRDTIPPNLILLLVGVNPGLLTGSTGFAYAHPSNLFWKLLHSSGITTVRHPPSDTYRLPELYSIGNTNIVERPTRDASMLSKAEMDAGVDILEAKIAAQRPEAVCLVGKSIWEAVWRVKHGRAIRKAEFRYGWQDESENMGKTADWNGSPVFVATTTSGLAAGMTLAEKQTVWNELGRWVVQRREERKAAAAGAGASASASASASTTSTDSDGTPSSIATTSVSTPASAPPPPAAIQNDSATS